jgi:hypothetical protein
MTGVKMHLNNCQGSNKTIIEKKPGNKTQNKQNQTTKEQKEHIKLKKNTMKNKNRPK